MAEPVPAVAVERMLDPTSELSCGAELGQELYALVERLYPIPRSLTGDGVRETLAVLERDVGVDLRTYEIPAGTPVYDWVIPKEWRLTGAYIATLDGVRVVDVADSNLHVVGYSRPVRERMTREALDGHLHSLPDQPELVPYRTSYYGETWGFCLAHDVRETLTADEYEVVIDSEHSDGSLTFAEAVVAGSTSREVLLSCNTCHPSLANDGASGIALAALLARELARTTPRHTYRFLFGPGTLGPLAWLQQTETELDRLAHGLVISCVGDSGPVTYKSSRRGDSSTDRIVSAVLSGLGLEYQIDPFVPWGGDERQFCSPGFDLPVGVLSRTPHGQYPEYHTSADNLELVSPEALAQSWDVYRAVLAAFDANVLYESTNPKGEPQLGRRGLYDKVSRGLPTEAQQRERARLWILNLADGAHDLAAIVARTGMPWQVIAEGAAELERAGLLRVLEHQAQPEL